MEPPKNKFTNVENSLQVLIHFYATLKIAKKKPARLRKEPGRSVFQREYGADAQIGFS